MDTKMIKLRLFIHQRLYSAAEEILGEVEKTITLALCQPEVSRSEEEAGSLRHQRDIQRKKAAAEPSLTGSTVEHRAKCDVPPSAQEELNFCVSAEVSRPSYTSADLDNNTYLMSEIKGEPEELGNYSRTQKMFFPSPEIVKSEQVQPEIPVSYELQPLSSDCSAAQSENNDSDEELMKSKREQTKTVKRKGRILHGRGVSVNKTDPASLPRDKSSAKSEKQRSYCHICGKGFQYIGSLMKHMNTHERKINCTVCGKTYHSTKQLIAHVKSHHSKTSFCDICGKTFANVHCLRVHDKMHKGIKEFACEECGKTFSQKGHLIVHVRTHSGEKPYKCDTCGKAFSQSQSLTIHKRIHSGEKPYGCDLCGKQFITRSHLKVHMRFHTGEKPYPCDVCDKQFSHRAVMSIHRTTHTKGKPYGWSGGPPEN
ncbi:uncharacterized protein LOC117268098 isoform X2 [Epinephelus lanceolatus]|uniref:zinc finger protein 73-like n=1 Tax=Epinephelus lanceolatus TaxID=310571 RepID=UPI00144671BA|nr:zinc finger protein 73-like [Epinephelus lanceolatus]